MSAIAQRTYKMWWGGVQQGLVQAHDKIGTRQLAKLLVHVVERHTAVISEYVSQSMPRTRVVAQPDTDFQWHLFVNLCSSHVRQIKKT